MEIHTVVERLLNDFTLEEILELNDLTVEELLLILVEQGYVTEPRFAFDL